MSHVARVCGLCTMLLAPFFLAACSAPAGRVYATPEDALLDVAEIAGKGDAEATDAIFGPGATDVLWSGDDVQDREDGARIGQMIRERVVLTELDDGDTVALVGEASWPFPIPLVEVSNGWRFDLDAGREELLDRRIGRNELLTIATLHAYVDAQREYASIGRDGKRSAYAQKIMSSDGRSDGLYWPTADDEPPSPLGPFVADAAASGYTGSESGPMPYHGYYYRIITRQGAHAPGGEKSYIDHTGLMTGGFAAVAWPATYGNSGVMTFVVNHVGVIFQKDLGPPENADAAPITVYDPDETWAPVPMLDVIEE